MNMAISTNRDHPENTPDGRRAKADAQSADGDTSDAAAKAVEQELAQGYRGVKADPTPNENYTVAGVTSGAPTPETDRDQAKQAREHQDGVEAAVEGVSRTEK
jgi:hypothetical protein